MLSSILTLALAGAAFATPVPTHGEFNLDFTGNDGQIITDYIAHGIPSANSSTAFLYIVASPEHTNSIPGTKFFLTGNSTNMALNIDLTDDANPTVRGVYNVRVPTVGDSDAPAYDVLGFKVAAGHEDVDWKYNKTSTVFTHKLQAPLNQFYLCNRTINAQTVKVLSFGNPRNNGTALVPPPGCDVAKIFQGTIRN